MASSALSPHVGKQQFMDPEFSSLSWGYSQTLAGSQNQAQIQREDTDWLSWSQVIHPQILPTLPCLKPINYGQEES